MPNRLRWFLSRFGMPDFPLRIVGVMILRPDTAMEPTAPKISWAPRLSANVMPSNETTDKELRWKDATITETTRTPSFIR